jgi:hypothetical protein
MPHRENPNTEWRSGLHENLRQVKVENLSLAELMSTKVTSSLDLRRSASLTLAAKLRRQPVPMNQRRKGIDSRSRTEESGRFLLELIGPQFMAVTRSPGASEESRLTAVDPSVVANFALVRSVVLLAVIDLLFKCSGLTYRRRRRRVLTRAVEWTRVGGTEMKSTICEGRHAVECKICAHPLGDEIERD